MVTDSFGKAEQYKAMLSFETQLSEIPKQRVLNLLREQAEVTDWGEPQDYRNLFKSGAVRYCRYIDNPFFGEVQQFYEEYIASYKFGVFKGSHYSASIPSGGEGIWDDADLLTTYGIDTATGTMQVSQMLVPWKEPGSIDQTRLQSHSLYGIDLQEEDVQWRALEALLSQGQVD